MTITNEQKSKAEEFLSLHSGKEILILPNVWNPIGARAIARLGFPAVATASAAIAESLGYTDGENIKLETMLETLRRITKSVDVPVTADIERGYAESLDALRETISEVVDVGVVGINIEDSLLEGGSLRPLAEQCERIAALREVAETRGIHLVINARVDSFVGSTSKTLQDSIEDAVRRAESYIAAGADCIYPMGPGDSATLCILRERIRSPLNVLANPRSESLTELRRIGINRVSFGPYIFRSCFAKFVDIVRELRGLGSYDCRARGRLSPSDVSGYLAVGREI